MNEISLVYTYNKYFEYLNMKCEHNHYLECFVIKETVDF